MVYYYQIVKINYQIRKKHGKMKATYFTNHKMTAKRLTEWYFGKKFVAETEAKLKASGKKEIKVWQNGTGYLTIKIN